ncbi:HNH endonuclease signature motif containing protein [Cupriavidus campinensis]|uniref:HNH endonuclease n=1 Tax=Cupriavidus campinensis TaxID=151783 RepID=A0AAE9L0L1_9BURK|nr:HNH endonuclease signature motif containing protein [Cupriavidus campinensis]URF02983.1 HNH endonuclease [Cupriavidus campinensis]
MAKQRGSLPMLGGRVPAAGSRTPTMQPGSWRTSALTSAQRGYGYRWQQARAAHLREHPFCEYCLKERRIVATTVAAVILECAARGLALPYGNVVDHRIPHRGDDALFWDRTNWQTLCTPHHSRDKQRQENAP